MDAVTDLLMDYVLIFIASLATIGACLVVAWLATDGDSPSEVREIEAGIEIRPRID